MYDIISKKRHNQELTNEEIDFFIENYLNNSIPDYQASALLMAIAINGMTDKETTALTLAMAKSGELLDLSQIKGPTIDKHSTGGVGDKTSLIIAPIIACLNGYVAKMSGKGLGHTGGTIDKLEAIGVDTKLSDEDFIKQVNEIGIAIVSQTNNLVPADKKIYSLRDVTATVDSIPLIASSIMSKKIAGGCKRIVLDVKVGSGAFMKTVESARELANKMIEIGKNCDLEVIAILTNMDIPLGNEIGNLLEIKEVLEVLQNKGPEDLKELCIILATYMNMLVNNISFEEANNQVKQVLIEGLAYNKFIEWINYQKGTIDFKATDYQIEVKSDQTGYITKMDTENIGKISLLLGSGRINKNDLIDYQAGITLKAKVGDYIKTNDTIAIFHTSKQQIESLIDQYLSGITVSLTKPIIPNLVLEVIGITNGL